MEKSKPPMIAQFERDCAALGVSPEELLREIGVHRATWFRWQSGEFAPRMNNWMRAQEALQRRRGPQADAA